MNLERRRTPASATPMASSPQPDAPAFEAAALGPTPGGDKAHDRAVPSGGSRIGETRRAVAGGGSSAGVASTNLAGEESSPVRQVVAAEQMDWGSQ